VVGTFRQFEVVRQAFPDVIVHMDGFGWFFGKRFQLGHKKVFINRGGRTGYRFRFRHRFGSGLRNVAGSAAGSGTAREDEKNQRNDKAY